MDSNLGSCSSIQSFVDRDICMRYFLGLAVGHKYGWSQRAATTNVNGPLQASTFEEEEDEPIMVDSEELEAGATQDLDDTVSINSMDRGLDSEESDVEVVVEAGEVESEDDELYAHYEMYEA